MRAGPAGHGPWTSTWLCVAVWTTGILMAHRHRHRSLATMEPPRKHPLAPGGSAGYSHQPVPHHNSVSSPTSLHSTWIAPFLFSPISPPRLLIAVAPGGGAPTATEFALTLPNSLVLVPCSAGTYISYIHLNLREKDKAEQPQRAENNHKLNGLSPELYSCHLCSVQYN